MHLDWAGILKTILIGALVLFALYRRFRRNFGRQPLRTVRMWVRIVILSLVCVLLLASPFRTGMSFLAAAIGAAVGIGLAFYALLHTRYEVTNNIRYYTPNPYIGMAVSALLIGRLIYRFTVIYPLMHGAVQQAAQNPHLQNPAFSSFERSPLTLGIYFLLAGYYIAYYAGVLVHGRKTIHLPEDDASSNQK